MGTLKLNKNTKNTNLQAVETDENAIVRETAEAGFEQVDEEVAANTELCELAKQDEGFVEEIKDLRTENSTAYRRNDRTCRKIITATPVRYRDANGELKDISNRLVDKGTEIVNEENSFKVKFNKDKSNGKIFDLQKGDKVLSLSVGGTAKARGHVCGCTCELCADAENSVTAKTDDGTEIQYVSLNDRIKENIIVKEKKDCYEYNFTLDIGDLNVSEGKNNELLLTDAQTGETEFIIPAPYMYDANNKRSDKVSYEIDVNGGELAIKVIADAEFINAENTSLPVIIDPQIVVENSSEYIQCETKIQTFDGNETIECYEGILDVQDTRSGERSDAYVYYTVPDIKLELGFVTRVTLRLTCREGYGRVNVGGKIIYPNDYEDIIVDIDVTDEKSGVIKMTPSGSEYSYANFGSYGAYAPYFIVEYLVVPDPYEYKQYEGMDQPIIKQFDLIDRAKGHFYVTDGGIAVSFNSFDSSDFVLPLNISHVHKMGLGETNYGLNWRLNINKKLEVAEDDTANNTRYIYTDELGDKYVFNEKYYYLQNSGRIFVDKNKVEINANGELSCYGYKVYKYQDCNGNTLLSEIDDFKNSQYIEQRQQERIQLEDYVTQMEPTLRNYVKVNSENGNIDWEFYTLNKDNYESLFRNVNKYTDIVIMPKNEALQLQSLFAQLEQINLQKEQMALQNRQFNLQERQIDNQITDHINTTKLGGSVYGIHQLSAEIDFKDRTQRPINERDAEEKFMRAQMEYQSMRRSRELLSATVHTGDDDQKKFLNAQRAVASEQESLIDGQLSNIYEQITYLKEHAQKDFDMVKSMFVSYFTKKDELELLIKQTPVNYIKDKNGIISGFNSNGNLVLICDSYGNYVNIVYNAFNQISEIYDSKDKVMRFDYVENLLRSITDCRGRTVNYGYEGKKLVSATFADGNVLNFKYQSNLMRTIESSTEFQTKLSYDGGRRLIEYRNASNSVRINKNVTRASASFSQTLEDFTISYEEYSTKICGPYGDYEEIRFDETKWLIRQTVVDEELKSKVTKYGYRINDGKQITITEIVNNDPPVVTIKKYDEIDLLVSETVDWQNISDTVKVKTETKYGYDLNNNLIKEVSTKSIDKSGEVSKVKYITNYSYNVQGGLVLTESYVEGEEFTSGKSYEQRVYDENGNVVKTISWNSLDSSSKFYSEKDIAENGQVLAEKDETGEVCAEYEYLNGSNIANCVKNASGGKFAYGRNPHNDKITSVTQSTESGEANCNDIVYQYGLPVEVKSGNTVINYEYEAKRRKSKITVNGNVQSTISYGKYNYDEENYTSFYGDIEEVIKIDKKNSITVKRIPWCTFDTAAGWYWTGEIGYVDKAQRWSKTFDITGSIENATGIIVDHDSLETIYQYDSFHKLTNAKTSLRLKGAKNVILNEDFTYNEYGELSQKTYEGTVTQTYSYTYKPNAARGLDYVSFGTYKFKPLTDVNGRNTGNEIYNGKNKVAGEYISYRKVSDHATNMPATVWFASGDNIKDSIKYAYDRCGNIAEIRVNGHTAAKFTYDSLNRLVREDNKVLNKTVLYSYDTCGNITERCEYAYTSKTGEELEELECVHSEYRYNGDVLVNYNGEEFEYNNLGSPTKYRNKTLQWQYGKNLVDFDGTTFLYDGLGRRLKKNDIEFSYDSDNKLIKQSNGLEFVYGVAGVVGFIYEGEQYFYRKDVQGNVIAILDNTGAVVVNYVYDAWGNHAVVDENGNDITAIDHIGVLNPFRYRGYYYDVETGLYYLQTRYYDPELCRFISQDSVDYADPEKINGLNLYAYCANNPVMNVDPTGEFFWAFLIGMFISGLISGTVRAVKQAINGGSARDCLAAFFGGFITGAVIGGAMILGGGIVTGAFALTPLAIAGTVGFLTVGTFGGGMLAYSVENWTKGEKVELNKAFINGALTFVQGLFSFAIGAAMGAAGLYNSLKPGNGLLDSIHYFAQGGIKSVIFGTVSYLMENGYSIFIRTLVKNFFVFPWNLIKP